MEDKYTLELTLDEFRIVSRALDYEADRWDGDEDNRIAGITKSLDERVYNMYMEAKIAYEHERRELMQKGTGHKGKDEEISV